MTPATASRFAKIVSPNTGAALRTAPGAHHWRVMFIDFPSTKEGFGDIIQIGDGSSAQSDLSQVPYEITFDRVYVHGDPIYGQKRGIALNGRTVTIRNSYISEIKAVGADSQAIGGWNGPGPFSIENNYLEAAAEAFMLGGSDPPIPNLVSEDVLVRYNYMSRPMSWRDPIVATPSSVNASGSDGGSLTAGVYTYRVVARRPSGSGTTATSLPSGEVTAVPTSGAVTVSWAPVPTATEYLVYVRTPAGVSQFWTVSGTSFTDNGTPGKSGNPPSTATLWSVKNIFELKNARRVRVEYNLFENNWRHAQPGYSILFTPRNQDGRCPWCVVEQVDFSHNIVRNVAGGISITGYDTNGPSGQTTGIRIQDNLIYGVTTELGGSGWPLLIGDAPKDIVIDHNTFDFDGTTRAPCVRQLQVAAANDRRVPVHEQRVAARHLWRERRRRVHRHVDAADVLSRCDIHRQLAERRARVTLPGGQPVRRRVQAEPDDRRGCGGQRARRESRAAAAAAAGHPQWPDDRHSAVAAEPADHFAREMTLTDA